MLVCGMNKALYICTTDVIYYAHYGCIYLLTGHENVSKMIFSACHGPLFFEHKLSTQQN